MTNWERIREGIADLFPWIDEITFSKMIWASMCEDDRICEHCALQDRCLHTYFKTDGNGEYVRDEDGDYISQDDWIGCDGVIRKWLDEEVGTELKLRTYGKGKEMLSDIKNRYYQRKMDEHVYRRMLIGEHAYRKVSIRGQSNGTEKED